MIWNWMVAKGTIQMRSESPHVKWYRIQFVRSYKKVSFQPSLLLSRNEIGIQIELGDFISHQGQDSAPQSVWFQLLCFLKKIFLFLLLHIDEERIGRKGRRRRLFLKRRKILRQMNIHELICTWCQFYLGYCWKLKKGSLWRSIKTVPKAIFQSWTLS